MLILTGGPGVGKTTIVQTLLAILDPLQVRCQQAPTGRPPSACPRPPATKPNHPSPNTARQTCSIAVDRRSTGSAAQSMDVDGRSAAGSLLAPAFRRFSASSARADQLPPVGPGNVLRDLSPAAGPSSPAHRGLPPGRPKPHHHAAHESTTALRWPRKGESADCFFIERDTAEDIVRTIRDLVHHRIPNRFHLDPVRDIQVLTPMNRGALGMRELNLALQADLNPPASNEMPVQRFGWSSSSRQGHSNRKRLRQGGL